MSQNVNIIFRQRKLEQIILLFKISGYALSEECKIYVKLFSFLYFSRNPNRPSKNAPFWYELSRMKNIIYVCINVPTNYQFLYIMYIQNFESLSSKSLYGIIYTFLLSCRFRCNISGKNQYIRVLMHAKVFSLHSISFNNAYLLLKSSFKHQQMTKELPLVFLRCC